MNSDILTYNPTQQTIAIEAETVNNKSYVVIQGGYDSCGEGGDPKKSDIYLAMAATLKAQADKPILYSSSRFTKNSEEIRYQLADGKLQVTNIDSYMQNLKASIEKKAASKVVVVAHSHGGWVALQILLKKYIPTKQISLITIDPISMKNCTSSKFMMGFLTGILPDFLKDQSCKEAPSDISRSQYRQIASSVSDWTNYYQLQFQYLHSGPLGAASRNIKLPINEGFFGNAHADIVKEGSIKNELRNKL